MADSTADFVEDYQKLARESWDAWMRQLQPPAAGGSWMPRSAPAATAANETLERTLDGLRGYFDWMQGTMTGVGGPATDWQQQIRRWFGGANQPFAQAFSGIDSAGAEGFMRQWQDWLQAAQHAGFASGTNGPVPAFGLDREQQMQQQELGQALMAAAQATSRYQALLQRAGADGMQRLQDKLAQHAEPGRQIESLKALYDVWVDASEEAYAELALSEEFRAAYGDMVNTQMHVRELQQKCTEALCQHLGMPTRSEVSSLGKRLQAVRRELRTLQGTGGDDAGTASAISALRRDLAALARRLDAQVPAGYQAGGEPTVAPLPQVGKAARPTPARRPVAKAAAKPAAKTTKPAGRAPAARGRAATPAARKAAPAKSRAVTAARSSIRKRK